MTTLTHPGQGPGQAAAWPDGADSGPADRAANQPSNHASTHAANRATGRAGTSGTNNTTTCRHGPEMAQAMEAELLANQSWEVDRALMLERSERRAWWVALAGVAFGLVGIAAVFAQGPLRRIVEVPIVVDRTTGETTIQQRLSVESIPLSEALDKHNLATFVRAREGYSWMFLQRDFDQVARMAVPAIFGDYNRQFEGENPLQKRIAGSEEWRIHIVGVRLSATGRSGNRGEAQVTYDKTLRQTERNLPEITTRHVASVVFEYQPRVLAKEKDRLENPFGFVVTAYRSDPEITSPAAGSKR